MEFKIGFTNKEITLWAGILMLKLMTDKIGFNDKLEELEIPESGSNRGYKSKQLVQQFMTSVWCGANKFEHTEITRQDEVIKEFCGFKKMAGHKAFQRFFNKFDLRLLAIH